MTAPTHSPATARAAAPDAARDVLCPMHLRLDASGVIRHAGPTISKVLCALAGETPFAPGAAFDALFEIERPRGAPAVTGLYAHVAEKLHLKLRAPPHTRLKAVLAPDPEGGGVLMDLSFGISILDGVRDFDLTSRDFAPTDLTIELLYLVEAKSAAMEETRQLNLRLKEAMSRVEQQAQTDPLTGLANRRAFDTHLARLLDMDHPFSLMQLDLDYFKQVNDTHGHAAGDQVLTHVAQIMKGETRSDDIVARVGGDEFMLIFPGLLDRARLADIAQRLIDAITAPIPLEGMPGTAEISTSVGILRSTDVADRSVDVLISGVDTALYASKRAGRARATFWEPRGA
ncbi:GGDEF domain-containing protein [Pseudaestuariivita sp.]|uniref:GGDEF domain-containing protein n=1 Tax=Pseudaestuariivita sp. TaxID=2211669 RepID=UPI0040597D60